MGPNDKSFEVKKVIIIAPYFRYHIVERKRKTERTVKRLENKKEKESDRDKERERERKRKVILYIL